jgi:hypothetical protein
MKSNFLQLITIMNTDFQVGKFGAHILVEKSDADAKYSGAIRGRYSGMITWVGNFRSVI